jgi:hypothetical protein
MKHLKETPARMVVDGRVAEYGTFNEPFREVNLLDVELEVRGSVLPRALREFRLKEWEHFGVINDEFYFGMVIFDAKFMGTSFFYAYDRTTGDFFEHTRNSIAGPLRVARELWHGECYYRHLGYIMEFENRLDSGLHRLRAQIKGKKRLPSVEAELFVHEDLDRYQPLVQVSPVSRNRPFYTHKNACPVEGRVVLGGREITLDPARDVAVMDVQKTYYPYRTFWKWATFGGYDSGGRLVGMNACENFITDDEVYNENCTWVDGVITKLSAARFEFNQSALMEPWRVYTTGGEMKLDFLPEGERKGCINAGVLMSDFHQPFGKFSGNMAGPDGTTVEVEGLFGLCEHHLARF